MYLGLDLSKRSTGLCIYDKGIVDLQAITTGDSSTVEAIEYIKDSVINSLHSVDYAIIENYSFAAKGRSMLDLAELNGVIKDLLWENDIPYILVAPQQIKKYIFGKIGIGKKTIKKKTKIDKIKYIKKAKQTFPELNNIKEFLPLNTDKIDAFVLAKIGYDYFNGTGNKFQREVISKLREEDKWIKKS